MTFYHDDLTLISLIIRINIKANNTFFNAVTFPIISSENKIDPQTPFLTTPFFQDRQKKRIELSIKCPQILL